MFSKELLVKIQKQITLCFEKTILKFSFFKFFFKPTIRSHSKRRNQDPSDKIVSVQVENHAFLQYFFKYLHLFHNVKKFPQGFLRCVYFILGYKGEILEARQLSGMQQQKNKSSKMKSILIDGIWKELLDHCCSSVFHFVPVFWV